MLASGHSFIPEGPDACVHFWPSDYLPVVSMGPAERQAGISRQSSATFFTFCVIIEVMSFAGQELLLLSLRCAFILWNNGFRRRRQFPARSVGCFILSCSIFIYLHFLHCNLSSILFIGLILSPAEIQEHCRVPAGSRRDRAHAVQKGEWFIVVWIYYQLFPFPSLLRTIVLEQHKLLLADLCIFVPTPSVRSHLTDIY